MGSRYYNLLVVGVLGEMEKDTIMEYDFDHARTSGCYTPEKLLLFALLADGVEMALMRVPKEGEGSVYKRELRDAARLWVDGKSDCPEVFSFNRCCEELGLVPKRIRDRLKVLYKRSNNVNFFNKIAA